MGGSPSEHNCSSNKKVSKDTTTKTQRYLQNRKGRASSFFLYHRNSSTTQPKSTIPQQVAPGNGNGVVDEQATLSQPLPLMGFEMEVASLSSSSDSDSDDAFTTTDGSSTATTTTTVLIVTTPSTTSIPPPLVEPHVATRVQFTVVNVRSYSITIGDHPCCTVGCPITLDWDYNDQDSMSLDDYEEQQQHQTNENCCIRKVNDLRISPEERVALLLISSAASAATSSPTTENDSSSHKLSELEIRRAARKFHRSKNCSIRQCERIHETFFHCPSQCSNSSSDEDEDNHNNNSSNCHADDEGDE
jgi:hypothetical protein